MLGIFSTHIFIIVVINLPYSSHNKGQDSAGNCSFV